MNHTNQLSKIFVDIDSTVADHAPRMMRCKLNNTNPFSREECMKDNPIKDSVFYTNKLHVQYGVSFLTARRFDLDGSISKTWLDLHGFLYNNIFVVKEPIQKYHFLLNYPGSVLIDDMSYGQENGSQYINLYENVINLFSKDSLLLFQGNWENTYQKITSLYE